MFVLYRPFELLHKAVKIVNKRRPRKIRPPYRRYGPGTANPEDSFDAGFEKIDILSVTLEQLALKKKHENGDEQDALGHLENEHENDENYEEPTGINHLPPELLRLVFEYLPKPISLKLLYVNRLWYSLLIPYVYECPQLDARNYSKFIETISNSNDLGGFVKVLDLRSIIQSGKNSYTARVLRRCAKSLQSFIAPQTSFGYSPLVSLRNCTELRTLDLALVSETVDLRLLFNAIGNAKHLERLAFPRSSVSCADYDHLWPPRLWHLCLSGGISNEFLAGTKFPPTIKQLIMTHCPFIKSPSVQSLCVRLGTHLTTLKVLYPMPALLPDALDSVLRLCPRLRSFSVSVDYISRHLFELPNMPYDEITRQPVPHPLRALYLDSSGMLGQAHKIEAIDVSLAILEDKLPELQKVTVSFKLGWNHEGEDMIELAEILEEREGGVWIT